jgi:hypothetical protein
MFDKNLHDVNNQNNRQNIRKRKSTGGRHHNCGWPVNNLFTKKEIDKGWQIAYDESVDPLPRGGSCEWRLHESQIIAKGHRENEIVKKTQEWFSIDDPRHWMRWSSL